MSTRTGERRDWTFRLLTAVSIVSALVLTAQAEWTLAGAVGWDVHVAWAWPAALDTYVLAAFRAGRDRAWALALMATSVASAHAVAVAFPAGLPWQIAGAVSTIPPLVAWRVHELGRTRAVPPAVKRSKRTSAEERTAPVATPERTKAQVQDTPVIGQVMPALLPAATRATTPLHAVQAPGDEAFLAAARRAVEAIQDRGEAVTRDRLVAQMRETGTAVGNARASRLLQTIQREEAA
jgi:hypothetical protein